jgi:hypothetical protein
MDSGCQNPLRKKPQTTSMTPAIIRTIPSLLATFLAIAILSSPDACSAFLDRIYRIIRILLPFLKKGKKPYPSSRE